MVILDGWHNGNEKDLLDKTNEAHSMFPEITGYKGSYLSSGLIH
jgi:hypothetical protein